MRAESMPEIHYVPVSDDTARQLTQLWQEILGIESIAPDQNYFDLGGDSSVAVHLFAQIEKIFGVKLPLATLFEAPTIEELARVLRHDDSQADWSSLVAIQSSGSRPPFFCIHGAGGTVLIYRELAQRLGPEQPFYGLQAIGLYTKEIRRKQPRGPYYLGGYCMGGTVAFEVAQQIRAQGEQVALLALFDTMDWSKVPPASILDKSYHTVERLAFHAANFSRLDRQGKAQFLREKVDILRARIPVWRGMLVAKFSQAPRAGSSESVLLAKIWQTNDRASASYVPKPYVGTVTDFRPLKQYRIFNKPGAKWDRLAQGGQQVIMVPSYPAGMLVEPFVQHLATALEKAISDAVQRNGNS